MDDNKNTYDDFNEYIENNEKTMNMLMQMSKNQNECIKRLTQDERFQMIEKTREELDTLTKENHNLKCDIKELKEKRILMQKKIDELDKITNVIGLTGDDIKVSKAVKQKCFKLVKGKNNDLYILFYRTYSRSLYAGLNKKMQVNRYSMIYKPELNIALRYIEKWKPSSSLKTERIQELQKSQAKGKLNQSSSGAKVEIALENYLRKTNGGTTRYAIQ